jgi:hypothetical protein
MNADIEFIINWVYYVMVFWKRFVYENAMMIALNFSTKPEVKRKAFI